MKRLTVTIFVLMSTLFIVSPVLAKKKPPKSICYQLSNPAGIYNEIFHRIEL